MVGKLAQAEFRLHITTAGDARASHLTALQFAVLSSLITLSRRS